MTKGRQKHGKTIIAANIHENEEKMKGPKKASFDKQIRQKNTHRTKK